MIGLLLLLVGAAPRQRVLFDDPYAGRCVATGSCPATQDPPAGGPMFVAIGLVGLGVAGLRRERRSR